ncbi:MAG: hypothetical protein ACXABY_31725 [Candidatus Thorarchaeota archaeon]|jgi:hypothetical protein
MDDKKMEQWEEDFADAILNAWEKGTLEDEDIDPVGSTTLAILQDIAFWNHKYTMSFVMSEEHMPYLPTMDAALFAGQGLGMINEALQSMNKGLPPEAAHAIESEVELEHEKIARGSAILVIAALRLAQENGFSLSKAVADEIKVQTGIDMRQSIRSYVIDAMKSLKEGPDETDDK